MAGSLISPTKQQVNVGVQAVLPEAERVKLIERRDMALLANQGKGETKEGE